MVTYTVHTHTLCTHTHSCESRLKGEGSPLTLDFCQEFMSDLQSKYPVEYATYNLSSVAVAIVFPLIKKQLQVRKVMQYPQTQLHVVGYLTHRTVAMLHVCLMNVTYHFDCLVLLPYGWKFSRGFLLPWPGVEAKRLNTLSNLTCTYCVQTRK